MSQSFVYGAPILQSGKVIILSLKRGRNLQNLLMFLDLLVPCLEKSLRGKRKHVDMLWLKMKSAPGNCLNKFWTIRKIECYAAAMNYMSGGFLMTC